VIMPPDDVGEVTFSGTIQPIFTANCAGCHNGTAGAVHPLDLSEGSAFAALQAYTPEQGGQTINTDNPEASVLYIMAQDGAHGYFNLSGKEKAQILQWITDGALNN
jgi:mono/diheme cytochrome c family protein